MRNKKCLSEELLKKIWGLHKVDGYSVRRISSATGIPKSTVGDFLSYKTYKDVYDKFVCEDVKNDLNKYRTGGFYNGRPIYESFDREIKIPKRETYGEMVWGVNSDITTNDLKIKQNRNVLVISDTHEPFCKEGYLEFCYRVYREFNCNHVIHIGDFADYHSVSYHEHDPDGAGGVSELSLVKKKAKEWSGYFPEIDVVIGNHDKLILRKAFSSGIPKEWIKSFNDVLDVNWNWNTEYFYDGVLYRHGVNTISSTSVLSEGCSIVQGHAHSVGRIVYKPGRCGGVFGMQVGCAVDKESYAMQYSTAEPFLGCGVVLNNGRLPILVRFGDI